MSPGQYFSNSSSMGNTNGYYIKNSVREYFYSCKTKLEKEPECD